MEWIQRCPVLLVVVSQKPRDQRVGRGRQLLCSVRGAQVALRALAQPYDWALASRRRPPGSIEDTGNVEFLLMI